MYRASDWEARLAAYLEGVRGRPFAWGKHDCCTYSADAVMAMCATDEDPIGEFRGRYTTAIGSKRALRRFGAVTLEATLDGKLQRLSAPALAHRGDLVMAGGNLGIGLGKVALMIGQEAERHGLVAIGRDLWSHAWRVPYPEVPRG